MADILDVVVVGAGPGGIAAALTAAAHGCSVLCVDKATFPRDKTCGDGLTTNALRQLEALGLTRAEFDAIGAVVVRETVLVSPNGRRVTLPLPPDGLHAAVATRRDLDAALVALARRRGVDVRESCAVEKLAVHAGDIELILGDGNPVTARHVIAADGHWSTVRRALEPDSPRDLGEWHAVRQYFAGVDDDRLWVLFERDLLPGYAWVFPLPGGAGQRRLRRAAQRPAVGPRSQGALARIARAAGAARRARRRDPGRAGAGVADPDALRPGAAHERARALRRRRGGRGRPVDRGGHRAGDRDRCRSRPRRSRRGGDPAQVSKRYRKSVASAIGRDLRFAAMLQGLMRTPLGARAAIAAAGLTPWTRRNFARWMFEDYPRALIATPDRWRLGAFTAPGAYRMQ